MLSTAVNTHYFWLRRVHSLLGLFPFAFFLFTHFLFNSTVLMGPEAFSNFVAGTQNFPLTIFLEVGLLAVPILFHILLGIVIVYSGASNVSRYGYYRNWMYMLQRATGVLLVPFIAYHVWHTRLRQVFTGHHVYYQYMHEYLSPMGVKVLYVIGILAACFHMTNGIATMLITWGITQSKRSQEVTSYLLWPLCVIMSIWGIVIILAF